MSQRQPADTTTPVEDSVCLDPAEFDQSDEAVVHHKSVPFFSPVDLHEEIGGRYILYFRDGSLENLYADYKFEALARSSRLRLIWIVGTFGLGWHWIPWFVGWGRTRKLSFTAPFVALVTSICTIFLLLSFIPLIPRLSRKWIRPETKLMITFTSAIMLLPMTQLHRAGAIFAHDPDFFLDEDQNHSDTLLLLVMIAITQCCFNDFPVRCSRSWPLPIVCVLTYSFFSLPNRQWSPHPISDMVSIIPLLSFVNFWCFRGRLRAEKHERRNWHRLQHLSLKYKKVKLEAQSARELQKNAKLEGVLDSFTLALEERNENGIASLRQQLLALGLSEHDIEAKSRRACKTLSEEAGVSAAYLLSPEFEEFAQRATGKEDPTFYDMKDAFFFKDEIGKHAECPRDGKKGCALVDTLPFRHRRKATHFLSWLWQYKLSVIRSSLVDWLHAKDLVADDVFLYMCFFVNNQYRILVDGIIRGSDSLGSIFESHLRRIKRVVAILEGWDSPSYLGRIWTIYEQFTAINLGISVTIIMPTVAARTFFSEFEKGKLGILKVRDALSRVDSREAKASVEEDEVRVKQFISSGVGFDEVNAKIASFMIKWASKQFKSYLDHLVGRDHSDHDVASDQIDHETLNHTTTI